MTKFKPSPEHATIVEMMLIHRWKADKIISWFCLCPKDIGVLDESYKEQLIEYIKQKTKV